MQKDDFNDILKQHASGFELKPASASFDKVMQRRGALRGRKRVLLWSMAASIVAAGILLFVFVPDRSLHQQEMAVMKPAESTPEMTAGKQEMAASPGKNKEFIGDHRAETPVESNKVASKHVAQDDVAPIPAPENKAKVQNAQSTLAPIKTSKAVTKQRSKTVSEKETVVAAERERQYSSGNLNSSEAGSAVAVRDKTGTTALPDRSIHNAEAKNTIDIASSSLTSQTTNTFQPDSFNKATAEVKPPVVDSLKQQVAANAPDSVVPPLPSIMASSQHWHVTALFTPQLFNSVYNANSEATLSWMKQYLKNREQNDKALYSYNVGLKVERELGNGLSVSVGALYSIVKFEEIRLVNQVVIDSVSMVNNGGNPMTLAEADRYQLIREQNRNSFDISFSSLEVPVQVYYTYTYKKMFYQATVGMAYSYLFKTRSLVFDASDSLNVQETDDAKNDRLRQHNLLLMAGANVGYRMNKRWSCYMGPVFRYSLNSIYSKDYIIRQQPYYLGLETGIRISF